MNACTQSIHFPIRVSPEPQKCFYFFKPPQQQNQSLSCRRTGLQEPGPGICTYHILLFPHFAHIVGAGAVKLGVGGEGAGSWHLKMLIPRHWRGPDNSWGPHQFVYSSIIRVRHLDWAPAEPRALVAVNSNRKRKGKEERVPLAASSHHS